MQFLHFFVAVACPAEKPEEGVDCGEEGLRCDYGNMTVCDQGAEFMYLCRQGAWIETGKACTIELFPVCGVDNQTYPNTCAANCGGYVEVQCEVKNMKIFCFEGECSVTILSGRMSLSRLIFRINF